MDLSIEKEANLIEENQDSLNQPVPAEQPDEINVENILLEEAASILHAAEIAAEEPPVKMEATDVENSDDEDEVIPRQTMPRLRLINNNNHQQHISTPNFYGNEIIPVTHNNSTVNTRSEQPPRVRSPFYMNRIPWYPNNDPRCIPTTRESVDTSNQTNSIVQDPRFRIPTTRESVGTSNQTNSSVQEPRFRATRNSSISSFVSPPPPYSDIDSQNYCRQRRDARYDLSSHIPYALQRNRNNQNVNFPNVGSNQNVNFPKIGCKLSGNYPSTNGSSTYRHQTPSTSTNSTMISDRPLKVENQSSNQRCTTTICSDTAPTFTTSAANSYIRNYSQPEEFLGENSYANYRIPTVIPTSTENYSLKHSSHLPNPFHGNQLTSTGPIEPRINKDAQVSLLLKKQVGGYPPPTVRGCGSVDAPLVESSSVNTNSSHHPSTANNNDRVCSPPLFEGPSTSAQRNVAKPTTKSILHRLLDDKYRNLLPPSGNKELKHQLMNCVNTCNKSSNLNASGSIVPRPPRQNNLSNCCNVTPMDFYQNIPRASADPAVNRAHHFLGRRVIRPITQNPTARSNVEENPNQRVQNNFTRAFHPPIISPNAERVADISENLFDIPNHHNLEQNPINQRLPFDQLLVEASNDVNPLLPGDNAVIRLLQNNPNLLYYHQNMTNFIVIAHPNYVQEGGNFVFCPNNQWVPIGQLNRGNNLENQVNEQVPGELRERSVEERLREQYSRENEDSFERYR